MTLSGIDMFVRDSLSLNAFVAIAVTVLPSIADGTVTELCPPLYFTIVTVSFTSLYSKSPLVRAKPGRAEKMFNSIVKQINAVVNFFKQHQLPIFHYTFIKYLCQRENISTQGFCANIIKKTWQIVLNTQKRGCGKMEEKRFAESAEPTKYFATTPLTKLLLSISLAPINHLGGFFAAMHAGIGYMLLLKRYAA